MHESRNAERGRIMKKTYAKLMAAALAVTSILPAVPTAADETAESTLNVAVGAQFTTFDPALNTETANNYGSSVCWNVPQGCRWKCSE